jgi:hypothetical protein
MKKGLLVFGTVSLLVASCGERGETAYDSTGLDSAALAAISIETYRSHVEILSSQKAIHWQSIILRSNSNL